MDPFVLGLIFGCIFIGGLVCAALVFWLIGEAIKYAIGRGLGW